MVAPMDCGTQDCGFRTPQLNTQELIMRSLEAHIQIAHPRNDQRAARPAQPNQVIKHRNVPIYGENLSFKDFIVLLKDWSTTSQDTEVNKQHAILESLQKNDKRRDEATHLNANVTSLSEEKTVACLIKILEDKYKLTKDQEFDTLILKIR